MKLSFITDEATQSFSQAVELAKQYGFDGVELRSVENTPIDMIPLSTIREWKQALEKNNLKVPCLASSFCKCEITASLEAEAEKLERLCDIADILETEFIRGFAFFANDGIDFAEIAAKLLSFAPTLEKRGKTLLLEADPSVATTNHKDLARLLALIDNSSYGAIYDPGNDIYDPKKEKPYPDGYEFIFSYLRHIHVKDAVIDQNGMPQCVPPGSGLVGWGELAKRLIGDNYSGWLSLETHYRKNTVLTEEQMRIPQGDSFTAGGAEATAESAEAIKSLVEGL